MLKIRSFLRLIKDSIRNFAVKVKRYNRHMAATAYALSAIILVFYFGNLAGFKVNPNEVKADAATYDEASKDLEETNSSESYGSGIKEYALNSPDHKILRDITTENEDAAIKSKNGTFYGIYPLGQLSINPAVIHYNDAIASMAILKTQQSLQLVTETTSTQLVLLGSQDLNAIESIKESGLTINPAQATIGQASTSTKEEIKTSKREEIKKQNTKKQEKNKEESAETLAKSDLKVPASLKLVNNKQMKKSLSKEELEVLQRIVEAEATGEDIYGKILVANVVLNRVNNSEFPNTISGVVFQKVGSSYQFSPTKDGRYYSVKISKTTKEAVNRALSGEDYSNGALYFFARKLTTEKKASWFDRELCKVVQYGCHEFYANK